MCLATKTVGSDVAEEDEERLERLTQCFGHGDRLAFLREAAVSQPVTVDVNVFVSAVVGGNDEFCSCFSRSSIRQKASGLSLAGAVPFFVGVAADGDVGDGPAVEGVAPPGRLCGWRP